MVHPSNGESWTWFDVIRNYKAQEARNVHVALATDVFHPYEKGVAVYTCCPMFVIKTYSCD